MAQYAYYYARVQADTGLCISVVDSTNLYLDPTYVPIPEYNRGYLLKYYYPLPETVTNHDDFQGQWYTDAAHTILAEGLNQHNKMIMQNIGSSHRTP